MFSLFYQIRRAAKRRTGSRFADVLANQQMMGRVFEEFLRSFFAHEQNHFRVGPGGIQWDARGTTDPLAIRPASGSPPKKNLSVLPGQKKQAANRFPIIQL